MIYTYVFDRVVGINTNAWFLFQHVSLMPHYFNDVYLYYHSADRKHNFLSLLRVSRQIYQETALLPYKLTKFNFGILISGELDDDDNMFEAIRLFLEKRSKRQIEALAKLEIMLLQDVTDLGELKLGTGMYWATRLRCKIPPA